MLVIDFYDGEMMGIPVPPCLVELGVMRDILSSFSAFSREWLTIGL
jgi:hypothetical protein